MWIEFAQDVFSGTAVGNLSQRFGTSVEFAVRIGVLKFIGQNASDRVGIVHFERLGPCLLKLDQGALRLLLGERGRVRRVAIVWIAQE